MLDKLKSYLESVKVTPISWLVGVSGVLMVRFFLESLSNPTSSGYFASDASTLIHYFLFFMSVFVLHLIIIEKAIPSWKHVVPQLIVSTSLFIFIAPLFDWVLSAGKGFKMTYFFDTSREMLVRFLTFGGTNIYTGATVGLRIEILLFILFLGILIYFTRRNWGKTLLYVFILGLVALLFGSIPGFVSVIGQSGNLIQQAPLSYIQSIIASSSTLANHIHGSLQYSSDVRLIEIAFNFLMGKILFIILVLLSAIWFTLNFKEKFKAIVGDYRSTRTIHYLLMIFIGLFSAYVMFPSIKLNWNDWLSVIMLCLAFYFSIRFAVCVNDIVDEDVDSISNTDRPLVAKILNKSDMNQAAALFLTATIISGFLAGYTALFFVLAFTALYYIYSAPPTRYKLIPFFSSFIIGLCSLTGVLAGYFLIFPLKLVSLFPDKLALAVVIIFFLHSHIRDIKDVKGDKKANIKTVPVLFGEKWGVRVVGVLASIAFLLVPVFMNSYVLLITALPAALLTYYFVNKKPYVEKYIFYIYFVFVFLSFLLLFI